MYTLPPLYPPGDGQKVTLDVENKSNDIILEEIKKTAAKPEDMCGVWWCVVESACRECGM